MNTYAARIEDGTVVQVIVGTPEWAADRLGGEWLASDVKVGVGWQVVDGTITPPEPEPEDELADLV
jgi:alkanesulfonate monooxygenase SsuD/methylene tetrahydromethanopterin reductase-like flavin-dependent oxidoreductase (luciferase family)